MDKPVFSMTGFGRGTAATDGIQVSVELRSVNARFLDVRIRLPRPWAPLEAKIRDEISKNFHRGTFDVVVALEHPSAESFKIDRKTAANYAQELRGLARELGTDSNISTLGLTKLPGVLRETVSHNEAEVFNLVIRALADAINEAKEMRSVEGKKAFAALSTEREGLLAAWAQVNSERKNIQADVSARLQERVKKIVGEQLDQARLVQEVAFYLERSDVTEELDRLKNHLEQIGSDLQRTRPLGKRLDFLLQEMSRETNTLGAKSANLKVIREVMEMKLSLERMREQVQNLE